MSMSGRIKEFFRLVTRRLDTPSIRLYEDDEYFWVTGTKATPEILRELELRRDRLRTESKMRCGKLSSLSIWISSAFLRLALWDCRRASFAGEEGAMPKNWEHLSRRRGLRPRGLQLETIRQETTVVVFLAEEADRSKYFLAVPLDPASPHIDRLKTERTRSVAVLLPRKAFLDHSSG